MQRFVDSADGVRIAVYEEGNPDGSVVVLVHGWPDSHALWDGVVSLLADRFRVVRYDNRGVGNTDVPKPVSAYTMACFADDFAAVVDAVAPGERVHVLGHDWGSAGVWEYLGRPGASERVASFTSVSGPSLHHLNRFIVDNLKRPYTPRLFLRGLAQLLRLTYMGLFCIPVLSPMLVRAAVRSGLLNRMLRVRDGIPTEMIHHSEAMATDAANSVKVYGANVFNTLWSARRDHCVDVPVQLIVNTTDPFVRPYIYDELARWAPRLWRRDIKAGHWSPMSHPHVMALTVTGLVEHLAAETATPPGEAVNHNHRNP